VPNRLTAAASAHRSAAQYGQYSPPGGHAGAGRHLNEDYLRIRREAG
jgi:hypothetical protein